MNDNDSASACAKTGIAGLDNVLRGGFPRNRLYLVQGSPGVGKTTMAMQFLLCGAASGETGLYITLSETKEELLGVAKSHNWEISRISLFELSSIEDQLRAEAQNTMFHPSEIELHQTTQKILDEIKRVNPTRVVFDSLSELRLLSQNPLRFRRQILALKQFFAGMKCTVLFLDDRTTETSDLDVQSMAHGVVNLDKVTPDYGTQRRRVEVGKLRGVKFREGYHDYVIETGGLAVFPRLVAAEHHQPFKRSSVPSGIPEMDSLLDGGIDKGTSSLFIGPAGCGKSSLAAHYAASVAMSGQKAAIFTFDENLGTFNARMKALGKDTRALAEAGSLILQQVDPAELTPGEFAHKIRRAVEEQNVKLIVIDSINGYMNAMTEDRFLTLHLHELLTYLGQQGVATILVVAQHGLMGSMKSPVDLTFLADTVVMLRYFESEGHVKKAISVIKKRSGAHEETIRELRMEKGTIRIGQPLTQFKGVLSGTPTFHGSEKSMMSRDDASGA
jgi:circadian clock protein KaiC